jgi:hypothetical protein
LEFLDFPESSFSRSGSSLLNFLLDSSGDWGGFSGYFLGGKIFLNGFKGLSLFGLFGVSFRAWHWKKYFFVNKYNLLIAINKKYIYSKCSLNFKVLLSPKPSNAKTSPSKFNVNVPLISG